MTTTLDVGVVSGITMLPLHEIVVDAKRYQMRSGGLNQAHAALLALLLAAPDDGDEIDLDPIDVVLIGEVYQLAHGHHRYAAYQTAGRKCIPARVVEGTEDDALRLAISGNTKNGLPWPHADRIMTLRSLLAQEEYSRWPFGKLARLLGIAPKTVSDEFASMYPGIEVREVLGKDGKTQMQRIGAGSKPAPVAPPAAVDLDDLDDGYEAAHAPVAAQPVIASSAAAPAPVASTSSWSAPAPTTGGSGPTGLVTLGSVVNIKVPSFVHPSQPLKEINISWELGGDSDGSEAQWTPGSGRLLPNAVKVRLIKLLVEGE